MAENGTSKTRKTTGRKRTVRKRSGGPVMLKSFNPRTGDVMREIPANSPAEVADVVASAHKVAPEWAAIPPEGRVRMLREVRYRIYRMQDELVEVVAAETGKTPFEALSLDVMGAVSMVYSFERFTARALRPEKIGLLDPPVLPKLLFGWSSRVEWRPFGVVGCITPWNYPLANTFLATLAPLFAGNVVVIKPSEVTPGVGEKLKEIFEPLPSGVVSIVQGGGDVGAALVDAPCDKISFIGSPTTGRKICEAAAKHLTPVVMELGGIDAAVVCDDVDLDQATSGVLWGSFFNCGQTCSSLERVYVADSIADDFRDRLLEKLAMVEQGDQVGSLTFKPQLGIVDRQVNDAIEKGATVLAGGPGAGRTNEKGSLWYAPTVIEGVNGEMAVQTEESFGPIVTLSRVADDDDAIRRVNEEGINLTASVWSSDMKRAERIAEHLRAGAITVNGHGVAAGAAWAPWGGVGESGFGRINGAIGLREFSVPVHVAKPLAPKQKQPFWYPYDEPSENLVRGVTKLLGSPDLRERLEGLGQIAANFGKSLKNKL
ncbi:MAG: aldehyde dehydrogenase family protein [Actinomycetota bacterium]|nr:aldehyde dehydrogenase family protein [Actinomycetota bacterium]